MTLGPLAWLARDYVALTPESDMMHRLGCPACAAVSRLLRPGDSIRRNHAPAMCPRCRPRVELRLTPPAA